MTRSARKPEPGEPVIVAGVRTPIGRYAGALKHVRPDDLAALVLAEVVRRVNLDPAEVEDVFMGCVNQAGEDNRSYGDRSTGVAPSFLEKRPPRFADE